MMNLRDVVGMLFAAAVCVALPAASDSTRLTADEMHHLKAQGFGAPRPSPFRTAYASERDASVEDDEEDEDFKPAATQARSPYHDDAYLHNIIPIQVRPTQQIRIQQQQQAYKKNYPQSYVGQGLSKGGSKDKGKEEEEEIEEPDRLSMLLPQSKFDCTGKKTGYYADEDLSCEVFHYCQDNAKHSWICPEGFTFHQVHLICMPPGGDNICAKSSRFHFVNEYLYKPINLQEHQSKPNVSLKYSDRYYPENYYDNNNYDDEEVDDRDDAPQQYHHQRKPISVGLHQQTLLSRGTTAPTNKFLVSSTLRPEAGLGQVFRSPEEVNISLQQRRPLHIAQRYRQELLGY